MRVYAFMTFDLKHEKKMSESIKNRLTSFLETIDKFHYGVLFYSIPIDHPLFIQAEEYSVHYKRFVTFHYTLEAKYDKKDMERAVAYIPIANRICFEYEDSEEIFESVCDKCYISRQVYDQEIRPYGAIKKYANEYATFYNDDNGTFLVSKLLYQYLLENGIDNHYFRPAYTRKEKQIPIAYQIISEFYIMEAGIVDKNYDLSVCEVCGNLSLHFADKKEYTPKMIKKEALLAMKEANMTYEYYVHTRELVLSKKLYKLIVEKDKKAKFYPVFLEEKSF